MRGFFQRSSRAAYRAHAARGRAPLLAAATTAVALSGATFATVSLAASSPAPTQSPVTPAVAATTDRAKYHEAIKHIDWEAVRAAIKEVLEDPNYDDGSYGPVLVRLAWHASGTYDVATGTGGSEGASMRFAPESSDGANAGLQVARKLLADRVHKRFPEVSTGDLWTLAAVVAIEEMGGPAIPWRPGRVDLSAQPSAADIPPNGRLPDASQGDKHIYDVFGRMGFSTRETVALIGAHALGRCHRDRSGYDGPWSYSPITFSNEFFRLLFDEKWQVRPSFSPKQYRNVQDGKDGGLMMLPTDMAVIGNDEMRAIAKEYAEDEDLFFRDFSAAFCKLIELGVKFPANKPWWNVW